MEKQQSPVSTSGLWSMMNKTNHELLLIRQRELKPHHIASQQLNILRAIKVLGSKATAAKITEEIDGHICAVSRQLVVLEKDGFVKRMPTPKSRLLKIQLTKKGLDMSKIPDKSKSIDSIFLVLNKEERHQMFSALRKVFGKSKEFTNTHY